MTDKTREAQLRALFSERRRELQEDVQRRLRDERTNRSQDAGDEFDHSDATIEKDVAFALLQLKADTLTRIDEAASRLDSGTYGDCSECGEEISLARLKAVPFATRCTSCEEAHEQVHSRLRRVARQDSSLALFEQASHSQR